MKQHDCELNIIEECWLADNKVDVVAECSICHTKFRGELKGETNE